MAKPPPHCECMNCYLYGCPGDNSVMCHKGKQIQKQWTEYYKGRFRSDSAADIAYLEGKKEVENWLKAREREKEKAIIVREKASEPKDRFYNFIFYASLLYILTLKLKWDINHHK